MCCYTCLPLFHANALFLSAQRALVSGLTLALSRRFSASRFWDEVRRYRATTFNAPRRHDPHPHETA